MAKIENLTDQIKVVRDNQTITFYDKLDSNGVIQLLFSLEDGDIKLALNSEEVESFDYASVALPLSEDAEDLLDVLNGYIYTAFTQQAQIYYVGKHGSDTNSGKSIGEAFLTFTAAMSAAVTGDAIVCFDAGTYTENLTSVGVHIQALNATLTGNHTLVDGDKWSFNTMEGTSTGTSMLLNTIGAEAHIKAEYLVLTGTQIGIVSTNGKIFCHFNHVLVENGFVVGNFTTDEVYLSFEEIKITGTGSAISSATNGDVNAIGLCIEGTGTAVTTFAGTSNVSLSCTKITSTNLTNLAATTICKIISSRIDNYTETGSGNALIISADGILQNSQRVGYKPTAATEVIAASVGGAINVTSYTTTIAVDAGGDAFTLAAGTTVGQLKKIILVSGTGTGVVTADLRGAATTITFTTAGEYALLMWDGTEWLDIELSSYGTFATPPIIA